MAKVTLTIDGKKKVFTKDKLTLLALKKQAKFQEKLENLYGYTGEMQTLYRKHRSVVNKVQKEEEKLANAETEEDINAIYDKIDEIESTEEFKAFQKETEELSEKAENDTQAQDFEIFDEFAELIVATFENKFTVDELYSGLELENNSVEETYAKIFANNKSGKPKKATTPKAQAK